MDKPYLISSISGGRTSVYMSRMLQLNYSDKYEIIYVFANTGQEHQNTLEFLKRCDDEWEMNIVWLEAHTYQEERKSTGYRITNYENANTDGQPYIDVVKKYGLPSHAYLHCTRELKENPIKNYLIDRQINNYTLALGIRVDEPNRIKPIEKRGNIVYPLVDWFPANKNQILTWFANNNFNLNLPEYLGNCKWCYKKTLSKLIRIANTHPDYFNFPRELEKNYSHIKAEKVGGERRIFRGYRTVKDIFKLAHGNITDEELNEILKEDATTNDCAESCEPFQMDILT